MKLAYILKHYPFTQPSIVGELKALTSSDIDLNIVAIRKVVSTDVVREDQEFDVEVTYLDDGHESDFSAHRRLFAACPFSYSSNLFHSLRWKAENFKLSARLAHAFRAISPDLVYVNWSWHVCGSVMYACRVLGIPFVFSVRGTDIKPPAKNFSLRVQTARKILTPSVGYADILTEELRVPEEKIAVIPNYFDIAPFDHIKPARTSIEGKAKMVAMGTLRSVKRYEDMIECCRILRDRHVDFILNIYGNGPESDRLDALITDYALGEHVKLCGHVNRRQLLQAYEECDILLHSSESESFCYAVVEAQAAGRAIVVADGAGGIRQSLVADKTALLTPLYDPRAMADAAGRLIADTDLRLKMAQAGRTFVRDNFTTDKFKERLIEALGCP